MKNEAQSMKSVKRKGLQSLSMRGAKREEGKHRGGACYKYPNEKDVIK